MKKIILTTLIFISSLVIYSCDYGVSYEPMFWKKTQEKDYKFTNSYDEFDLELYRIGGLIEYKEISLNGEFLNKSNTSKTFSVEKAILRANGKEYLGKTVYSKEKEAKSTKPNEYKDFRVDWDLGNETLKDVLKDSIELLLIVRKDNELVEITVPMINAH